jgi:hypothetical protein
MLRAIPSYDHFLSNMSISFETNSRFDARAPSEPLREVLGLAVAGIVSTANWKTRDIDAIKWDAWVV